MFEKRFSYEPFKNQFLECGVSHTGKTPVKTYDQYIRGILSNGTLYLRVYYPFDNLSELTYDNLMRKSHLLLNQYKADVLKEVKKHYGLTPDNVILNVTNDNLQTYLNKYHV